MSGGEPHEQQYFSKLRGIIEGALIVDNMQRHRAGMIVLLVIHAS